MQRPRSRQRPPTLTIAEVIREEIKAILGHRAVVHNLSDIDESVALYRPRSILPSLEATPPPQSSLAEELKKWLDQADLDPRNVAERKDV
jgi:hypothetical protein